MKNGNTLRLILLALAWGLLIFCFWGVDDGNIFANVTGDLAKPLDCIWVACVLGSIGFICWVSPTGRMIIGVIFWSLMAMFAIDAWKNSHKK